MTGIKDALFPEGSGSLGHQLKDIFVPGAAIAEEREAAARFIESAINAERVLIFGRSDCTQTKHAEEILASELQQPGSLVIYLDKRDDHKAVEHALSARIGMHKLDGPVVFVGHRLIGGSYDLQVASKDGSLKTFLANA